MTLLLFFLKLYIMGQNSGLFSHQDRKYMVLRDKVPTSLLSQNFLLGADLDPDPEPSRKLTMALDKPSARLSFECIDWGRKLKGREVA